VSEPNFDVAISFLSADEPTAKSLYEQVSAGLSVFFFPRNQEDLAGTDGLGSMRAPFLASRLNVVLYRERWGHTEWTRVEETAIKDACFKHGWHRLFFIVLDDAKNFPAWLPETHIRFHLRDYSLAEAVGAIKLRVQEQGGRFAPQDAQARARSMQHRLSYEEDKARLFSNQRWIMETVRPTVARILADAAQRVKAIAAEHRWQIQAGADQTKCVITNGPVSVLATWRQEFINVLGDLFVVEYNGRVLLPDERGRVTLEPPDELRSRRFLPELSQSRELCWIEESDQHRHYSHADLADQVVQLFLGLFERAERGEFPSEMDRFLERRGRK
jgi:hypothetical protein